MSKCITRPRYKFIKLTFCVINGLDASPFQYNEHIQDLLKYSDSFTGYISLNRQTTVAVFSVKLSHTSGKTGKVCEKSDPLLETMCLVSMGCYGSFLKTLSLIMGG